MNNPKYFLFACFHQYLSLNFGLLIAYLLGMARKSLSVGILEPAAFIIAFPLLGSFMQLLILPFMYDSPDSLAQRNLIILNKNDDTKENSNMLSDTDNFITTVLIQVT